MLSMQQALSRVQEVRPAFGRVRVAPHAGRGPAGPAASGRFFTNVPIPTDADTVAEQEAGCVSPDRAA